MRVSGLRVLSSVRNSAKVSVRRKDFILGEAIRFLEVVGASGIAWKFGQVAQSVFACNMSSVRSAVSKPSPE